MPKPRVLFVALVFANACGVEQQPAPTAATPRTVAVDAVDGALADAIAAATDGDTLLLSAGVHRALPQNGIDPLCGNCAPEEARVDIPITVGFLVEGKSLVLRGEDRDTTVLITSAGYGLYFNDAGSARVENLQITGGVRDDDERATSGVIVARNTALSVIDVDIVDNDHESPSAVAGIIGITGRDGADLVVAGCRILRNSWDGIALYRGDDDVPGSAPHALVVDNEIAFGRGVGVGVTWDSTAEIVNNDIHHYWKGIGAFGISQVDAHNNVVHDQLGWGVIAVGPATLHATNNVIANNGTTGLAAWDFGAQGRFANNLVVQNGWSVDEWVGKRTGVWLNASRSSVGFDHNLVWNNASEDVCAGGVPGADACAPIAFIGIDGNRSEDPGAGAQWRPDPASPLVDNGAPDIADADGTISDIGAWGGPDAGRAEP
jgi:hypothetical protein